MSRTTTDPKPFTVAMRLNKSDMRALKKLAQQRKLSRTDVLRQLLRTEAERQG
jgi:hypothetical protein